MLSRRSLAVIVAFGMALSGLIGRIAAAESQQDAASKAAPSAAESPATECRWASTPIVLDGKSDEAAWKHAQAITTFVRPWLKEKQKPLRGTTVAKLLWDREYLYFFADMRDPDLFADVMKHDGALWTNDAFELFFLPDAAKPGYYEFEVNAANAVLDAFYPKRDLDHLVQLFGRGEFRVESKVALRGTLNERSDADQGWSVEGRIPWIDFLRTGGRPEPGEQWRFSLCRCNHDKDQPFELTTTARHNVRKLSAFFHQFEDFTPLKFIGPGDMPGIVHGLTKRVPLTTSTVVGSPDPPLPYRTKRLYPRYSPKNPILAKPIPGTDQLLVVSEGDAPSQTIISRIKDDPAITTADAVKMHTTPAQGLAYDVCFHPKFTQNHYLYVGWTGKHKGRRKEKMARVTRYTMKTQPALTIDDSSAKTIIEWEAGGHNGLAVCFGLDGMMFVTSGDGTSDSDSDEMGQTTDTLLSKVLRLDVDHPAPGKTYSIPPDNPFVNDKRFAPETYAYGLRNPWRITTDQKTGRVWVGQNGQDLWEMAHLLEKGANYGWGVYEGSHPFYLQRKLGPTPHVKPTIEHSHAEFRSLTGGCVVYSKQLPELDGTYLYGDYSTGRIWGMKHDGTKVLSHRELAWPALHLTNFAQNHRGELLICDYNPTGGFYTLERTPPQTQENPFPRKLSESGLFDSVPEHRMKPGVVPYSINAPFWSDGMHKERFIAVPGTETIAMTKTRGWNFPDKSVIVKSFALEREAGNPATRKWIETRFFTKQNGEWAGYSYRWNEAGSDADLVPAGGRDESLVVKSAQGDRAQVWHYPSRAECLGCHSRAANFVLGLSSLQMNKDHDYDSCTENQLEALEHAGILQGYDWTAEAVEQLTARAAGLTGQQRDDYVKLNGQQQNQRQPPRSNLLAVNSASISRLVNPYDLKQDLNKRAKSWLHANCSTCHVEAGGGNSQMELDFATPLALMKIVDVKPVHTTMGIPDARLIAPGDPERSILLKRISIRGLNQMPQISTNRVDEAGVAMMREWIQSLGKKSVGLSPPLLGK